MPAQPAVRWLSPTAGRAPTCRSTPWPPRRWRSPRGADYLEQDLVASRDNELIVIHDIHLEGVTDVATRFPGRCRDDGRYYVRDFTLAELRTLAVTERGDATGKAVYPRRFPREAGAFGLHTLAEELTFVAGLGQSTGRVVGVYPELKRPRWHREEGVDISALLHDELMAHGYGRRSDPVFVQCFDFDELTHWRSELGSELRLVQLIGENDWGESPTDFDWARRDEGLAALAGVVDALGPWLPQLRREDGAVAPWVRAAQRRGLALHPYTLRADDLVAGFDSYRDGVCWLTLEARVNGFFTDFPDLAVEILSEFDSI